MKIVFTFLAGLMLAAPGRAQVSPLHCWVGHIHSSIPVFLWLVEKDSVFKGQVVYTRTKQKTPITLLGQRFADQRGIRICEYQPDGSITGIYDFENLASATAGTWFSPTTRKDLDFTLVSKDTLLTAPDTGFQPDQPIEGTYGYSYGAKGPQGSINIKRVDAHRISFEIGCHTGAPAYNLANVGRDTVALVNNSFIYKLDGSEHCVFRVSFYKHFLTIQYIDGYGDCGGYFGINASVDGIFYKLTPQK